MNLLKMIFKSNKGSLFTQELNHRSNGFIECNLQPMLNQKNGKVLITLYRCVNFKNDGVNIGKPRDIRNGERFGMPL